MNDCAIPVWCLMSDHACWEERYWWAVRYQDTEKSNHHPRWRYRGCPGREAYPCHGTQTSLPGPTTLLLPDHGEVSSTTYSSFSDQDCTVGKISPVKVFFEVVLSFSVNSILFLRKKSQRKHCWRIMNYKFVAKIFTRSISTLCWSMWLVGTWCSRYSK